MERYLTSEQVAVALQVHPFTVLKYLRNGTLAGVKIGRMYRVKESDVEKFLQEIRIAKPKESREPKKIKHEIEDQVEPQEQLKSKVETQKADIHEIKFADDEQEKNPDIYYKII
jgi:excisionase family DNA binding protein